MLEQDYEKLVVEIVLRHTEVSELKFIRDNLQGFKVTPIPGGSVNHVFLVTVSSADSDAQNEQHLVFKHAASACKAFPDCVLTPYRVHIEFYTSQMLYNFSHGLAPKMLCLDKETNTVVMEYIKNAEPLSHMLCRGEVNLDIAKQVGAVLAALHKNTWLSQCSDEKQSELLLMYSDPSLKANKKQFDFTTCLDMNSMYNRIEHENLVAFKELLRDGLLKAALEELSEYVDNTSQCVLHGDCHASCILVSVSNIKVIDTEFAALGVASKDIGAMLSFYIMLLYKADSKEETDKAKRLFRAIQELVNQYMASMSVILTNQQVKQRLIRDLTRSTGHCLLRFSIFTDLNLHIDVPPSVKPLCWKTAKALLLEAPNVQNINDMFHVIYC